MGLYSAFQPILAKYHPIEYGKYTQDFLPTWYKQYPWIEYDVEAKSAMCYSCRYFSVKQSTWFFNKWKQTGRLKNHAESNEHKLSFMKWIISNFLWLTEILIFIMFTNFGRLKTFI